MKSDHQVLATWCFPEDQNPEPEGVTEVLQATTGEIVGVALVDEEQRGEQQAVSRLTGLCCQCNMPTVNGHFAQKQ